MMKKISRLAALFAATAFLLAAFPACGNDDGDDGPNATLAGEAVELEIDVEKTVEATITVENDTFSANAKKIPSGEAIPTEYFELKAGEKITVSPATLVAWTSDTVAKISFTVTATEGAAAGTISAEIKKGTLTSDTALTAKGIAYTVKGASGSGDGEGGGSGEGDKTETGTPATAKTYNFVGLAASDFLDASGTAVSAWGASASWAASSAVNLPANSTTVADATVYCKEQTQDAKKQTLIRARTGTDSKTTALNYNGGASSDISSGIAIANLDRYVSIPVDGAGTITVEYAGVSSDKGSKTCQIALLDGEGSYLGGETVNTLKDDAGVTQQHTFDTTVTKATSVYIAFSRVGASGGGIDLYKIEVKPATTN